LALDPDLTELFDPNLDFVTDLANSHRGLDGIGCGHPPIVRGEGDAVGRIGPLAPTMGA
jgi:hypothetical protein